MSGDVDIHSVFAASLPSSHPSFAPQRQLDFSSRWKAPPLPDKHVELFVGILSAGNHFAERMAVRKSWMQHNLIKYSNVVARFFVALVSNINFGTCSSMVVGLIMNFMVDIIKYHHPLHSKLLQQSHQTAVPNPN